jgi:hypothetical protein
MFIELSTGIAYCTFIVLSMPIALFDTLCADVYSNGPMYVSPLNTYIILFYLLLNYLISE